MSATAPDALRLEEGEPSAPAPARTPAARWLLIVALIGVAASLVVRVVHRGPYIPGWDVMAPTQGHFLASTRAFPDVLREVFYQNRHYWLPFSVYSAPFSLIPGYLVRLWPSEYWIHLLVFLTFVTTLVLILRAADLPLRDAAIVLLGWGASPMLLSHSVVGYPWASAFLPHALALWVTMSPRIRRHWFLALVFALLANELSWHTYELGKTAALVFLVAAVVQRDVPKATRAAWIAAGGFQLWDVLFLHRTANIQTFAFQRGGMGSSAVPLDLDGIVRGARQLGEAFVGLDLDLPVLFVLGVASLLWVRRDRLLLLAMLAVQLGLMLLLAMGNDLLRPRRFIAVTCYALVCVACAYRDAGPRGRWALLAVLLLGNVWQAVGLARFVQTPIRPAGPAFTMPYLWSQDSVGAVSVPDVDWFLSLRERAKSGEHLLMLYNFDCYTENYTNPIGVLERLYLSLGHERFVRSISVFGSQPCRYACLPIRPLADFGRFLDGIRPDGETPPATLGVYYTENCVAMDSGKEAQGMLATLNQRFRMTLTSPPNSHYRRYTIDGPNEPAGGAG